ncbi:MAG: hypothetical protein K2K64_00900 [Muribaculaceae bacterium]|nr:hypothetical protein [Muribaculaceae bacterium]MDE7109562.1 hypothetical protein [Muribaculaceae bacterium]
MIKTYIAPGMLDWQMCVLVGDAKVKVNFTGGFISPNGLIPAKFTTGQTALQKIIEGSPQYARRRVVLWAEERSVRR